MELPKIPSDLPDSTTSKEERGRMVKEAERRLRELRAEEDMKDVYGKGTGYERVMWICLNRYYRRDSSPSSSSPGRKKGLTLFLAHANGFHKEV
jgi:phosphoenolpyruvate carboxylase